MLYLIGQILFCLLVAFLFGLLIGWLLKNLLMKSKLTENETEWKIKLKNAEDECITVRQELDSCRSRTKVLEAEFGSKAKDYEATIRNLEFQLHTKIPSKTKPTAPVVEAPKEKTIPTEIDDLKKIWGVGPYLEKILNSRSVYTFKQIANFTDDDMDRLSRVIGPFPDRIKNDKWKDQAKKLHQDKYGTEA